ncbi:MAG: JDVT-CTERM system glutamic-type intramembrane protease MrtJ [Burkholderiaceae bacterium]
MTESFGLTFRNGFLRDAQFQYALAIAPPILLLMNMLAPAWSQGIQARAAVVFLMVIWQPVIEEIFFRGFIQGSVYRLSWARIRLLGFSAANYITTGLFVCAHLVQHSFVWALAVAAPSLLFGHFRERHRQVYSAILLHAFYNACYLFFGSMNNG